MKNIIILGINIHPAVYIPVFYFLWVSVFLVLKRLVYSKVRVFAEKTGTEVDDILLNALELPLILIIFVSGIFVLLLAAAVGVAFVASRRRV